MELTLVVLAAGMGSRYGGLKQLDPVGPAGEIILDYSVDAAMRAGFSKVVFVIRRDMLQLFRETVGARYESRLAVEYVFQEVESLPGGALVPPGRIKPWGTGHAVLSASSAVNGPFAVINADDYYGDSGFAELSRFLCSAGAGQYAMVGYLLHNTLSEHGAVSRGIGIPAGNHRAHGNPAQYGGNRGRRHPTGFSDWCGVDLHELLGLHS